MIDCQQFEEQLELIALEGPDVLLTEELREHCERCAQCQRRLTEVQESWLLLPAALDQAANTSGVETAVMGRVRTSRTRVETPHSKQAIFWKYALAASLLVAVASSIIVSGNFFGGQPDRVAAEDLQRIEELARQLDKLDELKRVFAAPEIQYVSLQSLEPASGVKGYLVCDAVASQAHFFGFELPEVSAQTYRLWLMDRADDVISSASIELNSERHLGTAIVELPEDASTVSSVILTLEAEEDGERPSDDVRMRTEMDLNTIDLERDE